MSRVISANLVSANDHSPPPETDCIYNRNGFEGSDGDLEELLAGKVGWPGFKEVFTLSATDGEGLESFKEYLLHSAVPR